MDQYDNTILRTSVVAFGAASGYHRSVDMKKKFLSTRLNEREHANVCDDGGGPINYETERASRYIRCILLLFFFFFVPLFGVTIHIHENARRVLARTACTVIRRFILRKRYVHVL